MNERVERWADIFRQVADNCAVCGAEVSAVHILRAFANPVDQRERDQAAAALADAVAALDIVAAEKSAR